MEEAPENGKEFSNSAHARGMNEWMNVNVYSLRACVCILVQERTIYICLMIL
jgi:hypothetical protein